MWLWVVLFWTLGYSNIANVSARYPFTTQPTYYEPDAQYVSSREDGLNCRLRQTMAWRECGGKVVCDTDCKKGPDCTFPYCNWLGLCECTPAFCKTDRMCYFFMIDCHGNFTCQNRQCFCD